MSSANVDTVRRFYEAFGRRDAEAMAACYAADVVFNDAVFRDLRGKDAGDMWRMLCERADGLKVEASNIRVDGDDRHVRAHWDAWYNFGPKKRPVLNRIDADFRFDDAGRIVTHTDAFDFWTWSKQALGAPGLLLGWTPVLHAATRKTALKGLRGWQVKRR